MADITLTSERHAEFVEALEEAREALENAETVLANRIIDTDELQQDVEACITPLRRLLETLEDF